jgi:hypothetical protein
VIFSYGKSSSVDDEIIPCPNDDEPVALLYTCEVHVDLRDALEVHRELVDSLRITDVRETAASCKHISCEMLCAQHEDTPKSLATAATNSHFIQGLRPYSMKARQANTASDNNP